ncbi:MAG: hypothetical protein GYA17_17985 [Chloroflexi bacterium]|nr:hypothetical protein [Chloroflexota bacterium]
MKRSNPVQVYQLKATLRYIQPPVWRRILVPDNITLQDLHDIFQDVFGWQNSHLHDFNIQGIHYSDPVVDELGPLDIEYQDEDEVTIQLRDLQLRQGSRFVYTYDFGDSWDHNVLIEKICLPTEKMSLPQCIAGKRACPPEDVGGAPGYERFLEIIRDPQAEEHHSLLEWEGGTFDPEAFDLDAVNQILRRKGQQEVGRSAPPTAQKLRFDAARLFEPEDEQVAQSLPLRQDVVSFLTYLQENKVTGTQSTGNLPLKAIEEIANRFVHPPELETHIGEITYRFRSEYEVMPVFFVHRLAESIQLVSGGPGRRWRLTPAGEQFLTLAPLPQVGLLFSGWWYQFNWIQIGTPSVFDDMLPKSLTQVVASLLYKLVVHQPYPYPFFIDPIAQSIGWDRMLEVFDPDQWKIKTFVRDVVVAPLADFGVLTAQYEDTSGGFLDVKKLTTLTLTPFGQKLLEVTRKSK